MNHIDTMKQAQEALQQIATTAGRYDTPGAPNHMAMLAQKHADALHLAIEQAEKQEPVGFGKVLGTYGEVEEWPTLPDDPPQRQPLTEDEIKAIYNAAPATPDGWVDFARAIERAHKIGSEE